MPVCGLPKEFIIEELKDVKTGLQIGQDFLKKAMAPKKKTVSSMMIISQF
jgi:hypothetical protein